MTDTIPVRTEGWQPVAPMDGCTFSNYQASDQGRFWVRERTVRGRTYPAGYLPAEPSPDGYVRIKMRCDDPDHRTQHNITAHKIVLTTFDRPCPPGMEACHDPLRGPSFNWWPEGIRWDTKIANEGDKIRPQKPVKQPTPCVNHARCGGYVTKGGRRCHDCVVQVGRDGARLLWAGLTLTDAADRLGYASAPGLHLLAVKYGGYGRPPLRLRVTATLRSLFWWASPLVTPSDDHGE